MRTLTLLLALSAAPLLAETWSGTVVDVACKGKDLANHTRECSISCARSGYGLVLADGKFFKFDEAGNSRALKALKSSTKEKDMKATVTGKLDGAVIQVESIDLQ